MTPQKFTILVGRIFWDEGFSSLRLPISRGINKGRFDGGPSFGPPLDFEKNSSGAFIEKEISKGIEI